MRKQQFRRWQVIAGTILFLALMGLAGKSDQDSKPAILEEKTNVRDQIRAQVELEENMITAHFIARSRGDK